MDPFSMWVLCWLYFSRNHASACITEFAAFYHTLDCRFHFVRCFAFLHCNGSVPQRQLAFLFLLGCRGLSCADIGEAISCDVDAAEEPVEA